MKPLQFTLTILTLLLVCSCQDQKRGKTLQAAELKKELTATTADESPEKLGKFVSVDEFYLKFRIKYLSLAEAKSEPEFKDAFQKVLEIHAGNDIANFKLSCPYFYQLEKINTGINSDFDESNKPWIKTIGEDLHLILTNMLTLPPSDTVDLAMRIFAGRLKGEMNEDADKAREFLVEFNEKLRTSLK